MGDDLEALLKRYRDCFRFSEEEETSSLLVQVQEDLSLPQDIRPVPTKQAEKARLAHREQRRQRYDQTVALKAQGLPIGEIASRLQVSRSTIERFLSAESFPERRRRRKEKTKVDPYRASLFERWQAGCQNAAHVWQEIIEQGYHGSSSSVDAYVSCLRQGVSFKESPLPSPVRQLSAKQVHFLFLRHPTDLKQEEQKDLEEILLRHADLAALYQLVQQFRVAMHARCSEQLDDWVQKVVKTSFPELHHFVSGLRKDWEAVRAAFTVE